jgi:hypothetical protein
VNAIAAEAGLTHRTVEAALRRHGLARTAHAAKRHQAQQRAAQVAAACGSATPTTSSPWTLLLPRSGAG